MLATDVEAAIARSIFARMPPAAAAYVLDDQPSSVIPADTTIYREGEPPRALLMVSGLIRMFLMSSEGREVTIKYGRPPDVLGTALIVGGPIDVWAQTLTPTTIQVIDVRRLEEVAQVDARVAFTLAEELGHRVDELVHQVAINTFGSVNERVATQLLELASSLDRPDGRLVARLSRQELADAVGSVREVVARTLRHFRDAGLVVTGNDEVVILDPAGLFEESFGARDRHAVAGPNDRSH
jgi:CRP/FNR family transcriptional regulator, cyclic AMP receptor protein